MLFKVGQILAIQGSKPNVIFKIFKSQMFEDGNLIHSFQKKKK